MRISKGSITVFMSLLLMIIASLLFTLLEGSRYMMLGMVSVLNSQGVTESMFAEYHAPAYEDYHLFLMDGSYGTGQLLLSKIHARMQELGEENLNPVVSGFGTFTNFLQMDVIDSSIARYELATDNHAAPLLDQMVQVVKKEIAVDILQQAYDKISGGGAGNDLKNSIEIEESCEKGKQADRYLDGALDSLEQAKEDIQSPDGSSGQKKSIYRLKRGVNTRQTMQNTKGHTDEPPCDNPLEDVKQAKSSPLLSQILPEGTKISVKQMSKEDSVEYRELNTGNYGALGKSQVLDKVLITQYLKKYTSNFLKKSGIPHALAYEQEYLLFGKYSDEENLKKMAKRMLLLREGINFAYLLADSAKREEALAMATSITLFAGIPAAVTAVQMGILASWAYAESIAELRTLFSGGKIAVMKTAGSWSIQLSEVATVLFQNSIKAKEANGGQTYIDYLQAFLIAESVEKIGDRFANLLEKNLQFHIGYENIKMDCMITSMETSNTYHARQVFLTFVTIAQLSKQGYRFEKRYDFSYRKQKDNS